MLEQKKMMEMLFAGISPVMEKCGFSPVKNSGAFVYSREESTVMDFAGEKGVARFVFSGNRIHLLFGEAGAETADDSALNLDSTYLFILEEYGERDLKSLSNEISEYMSDIYLNKNKGTVKTKAPVTVSKAAAKSGALAYDPITLATKLSGMFPELKNAITDNIEEYGEFLCEDFFTKHANSLIMSTIRENNPQRMRRLFNILGEVYEDGTNEVQSLIAVTVLGEINNDPIIIQRIMPYLTDTMLEPVTAVNEKLAKSKSARLRLENPPKYKPPKKKKKSGLFSQMASGGLQQ